MTNRSRNSLISDRSQPDLFCVGGLSTSAPTLVEARGVPKADATRHPSVHSSTRKANASSAPVAKDVAHGDLQRRPSDRGSIAESVRPRFVEQQVQTLTLEDMPSYPVDLIASTKRAIKEINSDRVLLTYKEIDAFFGISRATVARRLKDGLVPGIRFQHGRVLEDGSVRRLDRTQVLYLLLAVRANRT
jgi:hypothetical protein